MDIRTCEICGQQFVAGYGYSLVVNWVVTGHAYVRAFLCDTHPSGQHWGCSPEHAVQAAERCMKEHMHKDKLIEKHDATGKPRYSEEDAYWAEGKGDNFHHVTLTGGPNGSISNKV